MAREKKCPRCAESVKAEAQVCRFCGNEFPPMPEREKGSSRIGKGCGVALVVFLVLGLLGAIVGHPKSSDSNSFATENGSDAVIDPKSEKSKAAEGLIGTTALAAGQALKKSMRNPDSLIIESARTSDDGKLLCVEYRAQNGFGGMNRDYIAYSNGTPKQGAAFWNKHCLKAMRDVTSTVQTGARFS
jgi:hypothetical protein